MKHRSRWLLSTAVLALALVVIPWLHTAANAAGVHTQSQHHGLFGRSGQFVQSSGPNLVYHGGPVMAGTTQTYAIFWEPTGSKVSKNYNSLILRYLADVGGSRLYHNNVQYKDSKGGFPSNSNFGASWLDSQTQYPGSVLTDIQIRQEITHAMKVNGWTPSLQHIFIVFTALNETDDAGTAYHDNFNGNTIYAIVPDIFAAWHVFPGKGPNNDVDADSTILVTSHEQIESATDATPSTQLAWIDPNGQEIGDKCEKYFGHLKKDGSNVHWNGHPYIVQGEWDNAKHGCTLVGP